MLKQVARRYVVGLVFLAFSIAFIHNQEMFPAVLTGLASVVILADLIKDVMP